MSPRDPRQDDDLFDRLLADYDEALAQGTTVSGAVAVDDPALRDRLAEARACLELLETAFPRHADSTREDHSGESVSSVVFPPPATIGRFVIRRELGRGGHGVVFLAFDPVLKREVALKVPRPEILQSPTMRARFRRESEAAARLDHPNLIPLYEAGELGPVCYLVSAYCPGPTLAAALRSQSAPIDPASAACLIAPLANAVGYMHARGVLHRDIKPANVILHVPEHAVGESNGESHPPLDWNDAVPKITDFGLACFAEETVSRTQTGAVIGTAGYMAPEQAQGRREEIGPATDVYALGVMLYELIAGHLPFRGATDLETFRQIVSDAPPSLREARRNIPHDLETIILKCLEKQPSSRYGTATLLADDLSRFLSGRPTLARPLSPAARSIRWIKRHPAKFVTISATLGLAAILIAVVTWSLAQISGARRESALKQQALDSEQFAHRAEQEKNRLQELSLLGARIRERSRDRPRGWTTLNVVDIGRAAAASNDDETRRMLRGEAVRALCAVELKCVGSFIEDFVGFGLAYSPDGSILAVGENGPAPTGQVLLFDAETRQLLKQLTFETPPPDERRKGAIEGVHSLLFAPDGERLFIGTRSGMLHVWNVSTGERERSWPAHFDYIYGLALSPAQHVLMTQTEGYVGFWNWDTGEQVGSAAFDQFVGEGLIAMGQRFYCSADYQVHEFNYDSLSGRVTAGRTLSGPPAHINCLAPMRDGRTIFGVGRSMREVLAFDLTTGRPDRQLSDPRHEFVHEGGVHSLNVSPDGRWLLSSAQDGVKLWELLSGDIVSTIPNSANCRVTATFHPKLPELALTRDSRVEVWRITGHDIWESELRQSFPVTSMDLSGDGTTLAGAVASEFQESSEQVKYHRVHVADCTARGRTIDWTIDVPRRAPFALSRNGRFLTCTDNVTQAGWEGFHALHQFDLESHGQKSFFGLAVVRHGKPAYTPDDRHVWVPAITANGSIGDRSTPQGIGFLANLNTTNRNVESIWVNDRSERELRKSQMLALAAGSKVVAASSIDGIVRLFDTESGELVREIAIPEQIVDALCLPGHEELVLGGTRQGQLLAISTSDGRIVFQHRIHEDAITALCGADNNLLFTGCHDGTLAAWMMAGDHPRELFRIGPLKRRIKDLVLSRDGALLAILVEGETGVRLLRIDQLRSRLKEIGLDWE